MHPLVLIVGGAALALAGKSYFDKKKEQEVATQHVLGMAAKELIQGKGYTVMLEIDSSKAGTNSTATMASVIKATFEQLGWRMTSTPTPRGANDTLAFTQGRPSQWIFQGQWTKEEKFMPQGPPWLGMAMAYPTPTA